VNSSVSPDEAQSRTCSVSKLESKRSHVARGHLLKL